MAMTGSEVLSAEQIASYEELGFVDCIPVLTSEEVRRYCEQFDRACAALGGRVTRLDGLHLFFDWAWELSTHPRLLDCMEALLGPNILLKSTRVFYKRGKSPTYVGWHQDGVTENLTTGRSPAIWLGLTEATVENGCLRVVPRSHRLGMVSHFSRQEMANLASSSANMEATVPSASDEKELSVELARIPKGLDPPRDIVMRPGEMSFHHPLILHGSNPNQSDGPRIGFSATYSSPELHKSGTPAALVRGRIDLPTFFDVIENAPSLTFDEAVAAYRASGRQILTEPD
jgi:non-haem Fe2+, alpha-ketoglutarate-dependent halogenase